MYMARPSRAQSAEIGRVMQAVEQLDRTTHANATLALAATTPANSLKVQNGRLEETPCVFTPSGTEANSLTLRIARDGRGACPTGIAPGMTRAVGTAQRCATSAPNTSTPRGGYCRP